MRFTVKEMLGKYGEKIKKQPLVSHTKGYYRYSKAYPGTRDEDGYRDNDNKRRRHLSTREKLLFAALLIAVFSAAYIVTGVLISLSQKEPPVPTAIEIQTEEMPTYAEEDTSEGETEDVSENE